MGRLRSYVQLFTVLSTAGILGMYIYASGANAQGADWLIGEPSAHINEHATTDSSTDNSDCSIRQTAVVNPSNGRVDVEDICITEAKNFRYGSYSNGRTNYQRRFVVSFGFDSKAYVVTNMASHIGLHPIPETNDLVTRSLIYSGYNALTLYRNIPSMLKAKLVGGQVRGYEFTGSGQGRRFVDHPAGARAFGVSNNGKWALIEVVEKGIVRVNLETGERRFVTKNTTHYGYHALGTMRPAISNDGRYGAIFYADAGKGAYVIGMNDNCGREVQVGEAFGRLSNACPAASLKDAAIRGGGDSFWQFDYTHMPRFSDDGMQLQSWAGFFEDGKYVRKRLDFSAHGYVQPRLEYLALGDSYSSGEGDTETINGSDVKWYRYGTDNEENKLLGVPREKCHISMRSYPYLLASDMGLKLNSQWQTVACSGATAWDVKQQGSGAYWGQNNDNIPRLEAIQNRAMLKTIALDDFTPGRQKQIEFVKKYQPKVITITMGGNDIGFGDKITACATPATYEQTCRYAKLSERGAMGRQILDQYDNLKSLYDEIYRASDGQSKVYALSYPHFINPAPDASCGVNVGRLNNEERELIGQSIDFMNVVIKQAASAAGIGYLDVSDSLVGYRLCDPGEQHVTGIAFKGGSELQESFHPNANGNDRISQAIMSITGRQNLSDYNTCANTEKICPSPESTKESIEAPAYFQTLHNKWSRYERMSVGKVTSGESLSVASDQYTFLPQSTASVTLYSDPVQLGSFQVDEGGSLSASIMIPIDLPVGHHTLVVSGEAFNGDLIELEQVILVEGSDPVDLDNNSIPDNQQVCGSFVVASGTDDDFDGIDDACDPIISKHQLHQDLAGAMEDEKPSKDMSTSIELDIAPDKDSRAPIKDEVASSIIPGAIEAIRQVVAATTPDDSSESVLGASQDAIIPPSEHTSVTTTADEEDTQRTNLVDYIYVMPLVLIGARLAYTIIRKF